MSTFRNLAMKVAPSGRRLAFSQVGEANSPRVLLCLPGLLETRATFDPLLHAASETQGLRVISLDLCGRGNSDPLPNDSGYCMSLYLSDVEAFIRQEIFGHGLPGPRLDVLGTSMGGILGMYIAGKAENDVSGLFLNDIGLNLTWMSIYGLYEGMKTAGPLETLASRLGVTEGAVRDVQSPHHFDLPHHKDWKGMKFGHVLNNFKGSVSLVFGGESGVCLPQQVQELQAKFPHLAEMRVEGAAHPVPFTQAVCAFVLKGLKLPQLEVKTKPPEILPVKDSLVQAPLPLEETLLVGPLQAVSQETHLTLQTSAPVTHLTSAPVAHVEQTNEVLTPEENFVPASQAEVIGGSTLRSKFAKWMARFK